LLREKELYVFYFPDIDSGETYRRPHFYSVDKVEYKMYPLRRAPGLEIPYQKHEVSGEEFLKRGLQPIKEFMLRQTRKTDLAFFVSLAQQDKPQNAESLPLTTVIPAFIISELKTAFQIGFLLYMPFIILDMVISSILLSMGMMMLPPVMISMPFKLMLFVMVDGWSLLVTSLVKSFR